jgi:hypothetical protein
MRTLLAIPALGLSLLLAPSASADNVVRDMRKACQVSVPADWTVQGSTAWAAGKKASATVHGLRPNQNFEAGKDFVKQAMKPIKVVQDDAKRLIYTMDPGPAAAGKNGWYVVLNSTPVCTVSFTFGDGFDEASLRKIADTLGPAK